MPDSHDSARLFSTVAFLALAIGPFLVSGSAQAQPGGASLVSTEPVVQMSFPRQLTLVGRSEALSESKVVAQIQGVVQSVEAREGRPIRRGDILVRIHRDRLQLSLDAKVAEAAQAAAEALRAEKELARVEDLYRQSVVPEHNLDVAKAEATRTTERHRQLEAERARLALDLRNSEIRAPFSGYTVERLVDVGEWVAPGTPVYELVDLSVAEVTVDLPEKYFGQVEVGSPVAVLLSDTDGDPLVGEVAGIAPRASEATHTFPVIVTVANDAGRLGSGMLVRARVQLSGTLESLAVSKDAVVRNGNGTMVYTVIDGAAAPIPVTTGSRAGEMIAVEGPGLEVGTPVVIRGNERIFPGSALRVAGEESSGAGDNGGAS